MSVGELLEPAEILAQGLMAIFVIIGLIALVIYVVGGIIASLIREDRQSLSCEKSKKLVCSERQIVGDFFYEMFELWWN